MHTIWITGGGTGGHLYPALTLAEELHRRDPALRLRYIGARRGLEARLLPERELAYTLLDVRPCHGRGIAGGVRSGIRLLGALGRIAHLARREPPDLVVATGGYASAPAALYAAVRPVPLVLQEQNAVPGRVTRLLAPRARAVHVAFADTERALARNIDSSRIHRSGNPVRRLGTVAAPAARAALGLAPHQTTVLVVGGSQGAAPLNEAVSDLLADGPWDGVQWLWLTGPDHTEEARELADGRDDLVVYGFLDRMAEALAASDVAISRAGALMTAELTATGVPAILVPYPHAAADHQTRNARSLEAAGVAVVVEEPALDRLRPALRTLLGDEAARRSMADRARKVGRPDAARTITDHLLTLLGEARS